jgi:hypothetical protein
MTITSSDKGGIILITTALGLSFALVSLFIRAYVRYGFSPGRFAWDDGAIFAAVVSSSRHSSNSHPADVRTRSFRFSRMPPSLSK